MSVNSNLTTEQFITEYIKEQCHKEQINNAIIILPETIDIEILKTLQ